ncbi:MAG: JAB domain-containing protein, partial [Sphingomonas sp.]
MDLLRPADAVTQWHFRPERRLESRAAAEALFAPLAMAAEEHLVIAYLDPDWRLLGLRHAHPGGADAIRVDTRAIMGDALAFGAAAAIMAHNHPSGDPTPSRADRRTTAQLARALATIDVRLIEHLVLA